MTDLCSRFQDPKQAFEYARMFHQHSKVRKKKSKDEGLISEQELNLGCDFTPKSLEGRSWMGFETEDYGKPGGMESTSTLFEKVVPVRVTKANAEDRHMDLTARFIMGLSKVHRSTKVLQVQITNELDPFFFYSLEVNEDDFQSLKVEQCILVDFATFPYKFIELLEQCIVSSCVDNPRFLAVLHLRTGDATLTVVETNQFKHLSHLSLVFRQGNDTVVKQFLAGRLAEYKAINGDMHEKLRRTLNSLEKALRDANNLSSDLGELKENQCRHTSEMKAEFTLELAHEKEKVMQETRELKERLDKERMELETRLRQQIDQQQQRASDLDRQVRSLLDAKYTTDNIITELKNKSASLEKNLEEKTQEGDRLRKEKRNLEAYKTEAEKENNRHLIRLSALEQEVSDKNELISKMTTQVEAQALQRSALETSRKETQAAADRAEERASANATELTKCHQIIEKLQVELRASKQKVKLKGQVTSQQDNLLTERQAAIEKAEAENATLRHELTTMKTDMEDKKKKIEEITTKLDEAQTLQQSNQQMIQWLNQQLTEAQLAKLPVAPPSSRFSTAFTRGSNPSNLTYSCLTTTTNNNNHNNNNNRPGDASTTPLSSNSSLGGNTNPAFKHQFPMSSPYLSSSALAIPGLLAGHHHQRSMYVPVTKIAVQAGQKAVGYNNNKSKRMVDGRTTTPPLLVNNNLSSWEDWGSKQNPLPRPQLSFADRSEYSSLTKSAIAMGRSSSNNNLAAADHGSRPPSPTRQQRQSPNSLPPAAAAAAAAGDRSGCGNNDPAGRRTPVVGNETDVVDQRAASSSSPPKATNRPSPPRSSSSVPNRENASPARTNRSPPQKSHFSRR